MRGHYDAIIIGAGVIGAAIAFELAKSGRRTLSIDKLPAAGYGPTSSSCAIIRVHYSTLEGTALAYDAYFDWKDWENYLEAPDESGLARFIACGCLIMQTEQNQYLTKHTSICDELQIPYERWDGAAIQGRLPIVDLKGYFPPKRLEDPGFGEPTGHRIEGGIFFPTAGYVSDPQLATHNLQRAAEAKGAGFVFGRRVAGISKRGGRIAGVVLEDGTEIEAPVVVNVAGAHSAIINRMAGAEVDMTIGTRPLRQEVVHLPAPAAFDMATNGIVISDGDIACYSRPETGNHLLIGSEDPECDPREEVDPDAFDRSFTEQWDTQAARMAQRIPSLGIPSRKRGVVDLYDVSDDWIPIYDRSAIPGFYMAVGTSGNQFKNAPVAGKLMTALIDYCEGGGDHDREPLQFALPHLGRPISLAFCSRRRTLNPESSFSVLG